MKTIFCELVSICLLVASFVNYSLHLQDYNDVLSDISGWMNEHKIDYFVIAGDLNTDLSRLNSGNTLSS